MSINPTFSKVLQTLATPLAALGDCQLCGARNGGRVLCAACFQGLPALPASRCPRCALPTPAAGLCGACLRQPPHFDATVARWAYGFPLDQLIQALKFGHRLLLAELFAEAMLSASPAHGDLLLPVPISAERLRERGFNQAVEIARRLAARLAIPLSLHDVIRPLHTAAQSSLPWKVRRRNMRHAFRGQRDLSGLHVIVVDDVMTTGATLDELAGTLKLQGASRVSNWVVARTVRED